MCDLLPLLEGKMIRCAGIDVSKSKLDVCIWPSPTVSTFENNEDGIDLLVRSMREAEVDLVAIEHTGRLTRTLIDRLQANSISAVFLDPRQVRHFGVSVGREAKTDKLDARLIAHYATLLQPTVRPITSEEEYELKYTVVRRRQLVDHRSKEKTRSHEVHTDFLAESIELHHAWLDGEIDRIERHIRDQIRNQPAWQDRYDILVSMPGVGDVLAWTLIADLGTIRLTYHA